MTCQFCRKVIRQPGFCVVYQERYYHEKCFEKLRSVARHTGGTL